MAIKDDWADGDTFTAADENAVGAALNTAAQMVAAPASANATGVVGQIAADGTYFYVCVAENTWRRSAVGSWGATARAGAAYGRGVLAPSVTCLTVPALSGAGVLAATITFVAPPEYGAAGTSVGGATSTTAAVPVPAGVVAGSGVVVVLYVETTQAVTPPAGFTEAANSPAVATGSGAHDLHVFEHVATGVESGTYAFTLAGSPTTPFRDGQAIRIDHVPTNDTSIFDDCDSAAKSTTTDGGIPAVSVATTGADRMLLWVGANFTGTGAGGTTSPTGFTERIDTPGYAVATKAQPTQGSSGAVTGTVDVNSATTAWMGAIKPGTSTSPPSPPESPPYAITGTTYYVSNAGNDSLAGTTPETAWATVERAIQQSYTAGDGLLFRRGDTFYMNMINKTVTANGTKRWIIGAYGSGAKPILSHYKILNNSGSWTLHSTGVWKINLSNTSTHTGFLGPWTGLSASSWTNIGHLLIDGVAYGYRRASVAALANQWDFYGWPDTTYLYVKSSANPTSLASDIKAAPNGRMVYTNSNTEVVDLEIVGSGGNGLQGAGGSNIVISRNFVHHIGGSILIGYGDNTTRYGNCHEFSGGTSNATVNQNIFEDAFDTGLTIQGSGNASNIVWTDNDVARCSMNVELFKDGAGTWNNIKVENNRLVDGGNGWGGPPQPNQDRRNNITIGPGWQSTITNVFIRYNTCIRAASWHYFIWNNGSPGIPNNVTFASNDIRLTSGTHMQWPRSETINQADAWRTATGLDQGSTFTVL